MALKLGGTICSGLKKRISKGFTNMTAQDWMDVIVFSSFSVFGEVSRDIDQMIRQLREAIVLYTNREISEIDIDRASVLLKLSLTTCSKKFGISPPNFHIAMHMPETIRAFGPSHV